MIVISTFFDMTMGGDFITTENKLIQCELLNHEENAKVFKALCDPKRLYILEILKNEQQCACDLIEKTKIPQSAISYHMKILIESNLVDSWQIGKWTHYKISESGREQAFLLLKNLLDIK